MSVRERSDTNSPLHRKYKKSQNIFEDASAILHLTKVLSMRLKESRHLWYMIGKRSQNGAFWPFLPSKKGNASAGATKTALSHKQNEAFVLITQKRHPLRNSSLTGFKTLESMGGLKMHRNLEDLPNPLTKSKGCQVTLSDIREGP